jgi:hypothetical protein
MPDEQLPAMRDYGTNDVPPPPPEPDRPPAARGLTPLGWGAVASCVAVLVSIAGPWATAFGIVSIDGTHGDIPTVGIAALLAAGGFILCAREREIDGGLLGLIGALWIAYVVAYEYDHLHSISPFVSVGWGLYLCGLGMAGIIGTLAATAFAKRPLTR